jgi:hypothetical protein
MTRYTRDEADVLSWYGVHFLNVTCLSDDQEVFVVIP